jgi:hypothetical protein
LPLPMRTARQFSRVARTEYNPSSELATGVFPVTELAMSMRSSRPFHMTLH